MTALRRAARDYLTVRRALGHKLRRTERYLDEFVTYLESVGADVITEAAAVSWAAEQAEPARRLGSVRLFADYVRSIDARTEVLPRGVFPTVRRRATPHIYTDDQIEALVEAAKTMQPPMAPRTYATLIGLLAVSGMRVGEAIALDRGDFNGEQGVVLVRNAKFGKTRQIPLHATGAEALRRYERQRDRTFKPRKTSSFFVSNAGTRLHAQNVNATFVRLLRKASMANQPGQRPTLHDFRHSFATRTLEEWTKAGGDIEARLPFLSAYLGHVSPSSTYWYLTATPGLACAAVEQLESHLGRQL